MTFTAAASQHPVPEEATAEVVGQTLEHLSGSPDLAVLFCSRDHAGAFADIAGMVRSVIEPRRLIGSLASGAIGGRREIEQGPVVSLWTGQVGGVPQPVRLTSVRTGSGTAIQGLSALPEPAEQTGDEAARATGDQVLLLLCDPLSLPVADVLDVLATRKPPLRTIGGVASAGLAPGANLLALDDEVFTSGAVGTVLPATSTVSIAAFVSQGCRPIGPPMIVTRASGDQVTELAGQPALARLQQVARQADAEDRTLLAKGVHLGIAADEHRDAFERGDFLVRNIVGADREHGNLIVGSSVEVGTTVQFHVQDSASADEDLRGLLAKHGAADAALVFTCNGRGRRLFGAEDHDAELVAEVADGLVAGMFCAGEIGPVGDRSFLHAFTASVVLFRERR
jgi:small ligand-binding sensory domain FIST